jgi:hypothetical protein
VKGLEARKRKSCMISFRVDEDDLARLDALARRVSILIEPIGQTRPWPEKGGSVVALIVRRRVAAVSAFACFVTARHESEAVQGVLVGWITNRPPVS